jgi:hypothetical protein
VGQELHNRSQNVVLEFLAATVVHIIVPGIRELPDRDANPRPDRHAQFVQTPCLASGTSSASRRTTDVGAVDFASDVAQAIPSVPASTNAFRAVNNFYSRPLEATSVDGVDYSRM